MGVLKTGTCCQPVHYQLVE